MVIFCEFLLRGNLFEKKFTLLQLYPLEGATSIEKHDTFGRVGVSLAKTLTLHLFYIKKKKKERKIANVHLEKFLEKQWFTFEHTSSRKKQFAKGVLRYCFLSIEDLLVQKLNMTKL